MKIVVIGGSGFLGSHVADELANEGHEVTIFDKGKSQWISKNQKMVIGAVLSISDLEKVISKAKQKKQLMLRLHQIDLIVWALEE